MNPLEELAATAAAIAKQNIAVEGETFPTWYIVCGDGQLIVQRTAWRDYADKMRWLSVLRFGMEAMNAQRYVLVSESWMVSVATEDEARYRAGRGLSKDPDRTEVLSIIGEDTNNQFINAFIPIIRHGDGEPATFGEMDRGDSLNESRFLGLLPRRGTAQ